MWSMVLNILIPCGVYLELPKDVGSLLASLQIMNFLVFNMCPQATTLSLKPVADHALTGSVGFAHSSCSWADH